MNTVDNSVKARSPLISGLIYAFIFMGICTLILSLLLWLSNFQERSLSTAAYVVHGVAVLTGGFISGRNSLRKGWLNGGLVGIFYALIVILVGFLGFDSGMTLQTLILIGLCAAAAAVGGMFGVNMRK